MGMLSVLTSVISGVCSNRVYNSLYNINLEDKISECYYMAEERFYKKFENEFGDKLNSFLTRQQNIDYLKETILFKIKEPISSNEFNNKSYNAEIKNVDIKIIDEFIKIFLEIVKEDYELNRIIIENDHIREQNNINEMIKEMFNTVKESNELLKHKNRTYGSLSNENYKEIISIYEEEDLIEQEFRLITWLNNNSGNKEGVILKAYIAYKHKQWELAYKLYKYIINKYEEEYELYNILGLICEKIGNYNEAEIYYNKVLEKDEKNLNILFNLGTLYKRRLNNAEKALEFLLKAYEVAPNDSEVLNNIGIVYKQNKEYKEAEKYIEMAIKNSNGNPLPYLNMGELQMDIYNDFEKAIVYFEEYIKFDKVEKGVIYNVLGLIYGSILYKDKKRAKEYFIRAMDFENGRNEATINLKILESTPRHFDILRTFSGERQIDLLKICSS